MDFSGASSIFHEDLRLNGNDHEPIKNAMLAESISSIMTKVEMAKDINLQIILPFDLQNFLAFGKFN